MLLKKIIYLLAFLILSVQTFASHIIGGDFSLEYKQGNTYLLRLKVYRDNVNGVPGFNRDPIKIGVYDKETNAFVDSILMDFDQPYEVKFNDEDCVDNSIVGLDAKLYFKEILLEPSKYNNTAGYYFSWERCCRNNIIANIEDSGNTGMAFYMEIPSPHPLAKPEFINSSPRFMKDPLNYLCVGKPFVFNFGVTEKDGDQLIYSLIVPLKGNTTNSETNGLNTFLSSGPYPEITWAPNYSLSNIMNGSPDLAINSTTGDLTITPTRNGVYVFSVLVSEFRNGIKIGEVRREIQFFVADCEVYKAPSIVTFLPNNVATLVLGKNNCIDFQINDNLGDQLKFKVKSIGIDIFKMGAFIDPISQTGNGNIVGTICWTPPCDLDTNIKFNLEIFAYDDSCPDSLSALVNLNVNLEPYQNSAALFVLPIDSVFEAKLGEKLEFDIGGIDLNFDSLFLTAESEIFSLDRSKPIFDNAEGVGIVNSKFTWLWDCDVLRDEPYIVSFKLRDRFCSIQNEIIYRVKIKLTEGTDSTNLELKNVFTPNGDGINDTYKLPAGIKTCLENFEITIFSRWGEVLFKSIDQDFEWDGNGISDGVYFYVVSALNKKLSGTITILR